MSVIPNYGFSNKTSINCLSVEAFLKKVSCEQRTVCSGLDGVKVIPLLLSVDRHGTMVWEKSSITLPHIQCNC